MPCLPMATPEAASNRSHSIRWIDDTPEWFPRVEILAVPISGAVDVPGPGDPDDDDGSDVGVGNIDPEDDEGYDDGEEDDDEEDTLWASPAASSSPPNRA
jgi:hypothetical protein